MDAVLMSRPGHMLVSFITINEHDFEAFQIKQLEQHNFRRFLQKLAETQEMILPQGIRVNKILDFMGCTGNVVYFH